MLDSGTTFTYLPSDAFQSFKETVTAFALEHGLKSVKGPDPKVGTCHVWHCVCCMCSDCVVCVVLNTSRGFLRYSFVRLQPNSYAVQLSILHSHRLPGASPVL